MKTSRLTSTPYSPSLTFGLLVFATLCGSPLRSRLEAQTSWLGTSDANWGTAGNWSNGLPNNSTTTFFGTSATTTVGVNISTNLKALEFNRDASAMSFTNSGGGFLSFTNSSAINMRYGSKAQTFNSNIQLIGSSSTLATFRNDSLAGSMLLNGGVSTTAVTNLRLLSFTGLGGGTVGDLTGGALGIDNIVGGGTWTFNGTNTYGASRSASESTTLGGGASLVLDYTTNNTVKFRQVNMLYMQGGTLDIRGNSAGTTASFDKIGMRPLRTVGTGYGFANTINSVSGAGGLTVALGLITRNNNSWPDSQGHYLHLTGDATFTTTTPSATIDSIGSTLLLNKDYAAVTGGTIVARSSYTALPSSGTGSTSTYYNYTANSGATALSLGGTFAARGLKFSTSEAGSLDLGTTRLTLSDEGSLLFVGDHNYTITAGGFGNAANTNWINLGSGVLTLDGGITGTFLKAGRGTIALTKASTLGVAGVHVGEGMLVFRNSDVMGASPSNGAFVQAGATLRLENDINLHAGTTVNLHGLGLDGAGALQNGSGNNSVGGDVVLGLTSRIRSNAGVLTLNGGVDGVAAGVALLFDGDGDTVVNGAIGGNVTYGVSKSGDGKLTLAGSNAFSGDTSITRGSVVVANTNALGAGTVAIGSHGALVVNSGVANFVTAVNLNGGTFVYNGANSYDRSHLTFSSGTLAGSGTFGGDLALNNTAQVLAPGNSPGIMVLEDAQNWSAFTYQWEINNFSGTVAGTDFDQISILSDLTFSLDGTYILNVTSLLEDNSLGNVPGFLEVSRDWVILTAAGGIAGFDLDNWTIDTSLFSSNSGWTGNWSLSVSGADQSNLVLSYAVPEPSTWVLAILSLMGVGIGRAARAGKGVQP